ncbi:SPRY domain-containing protein [Bradyrhizobium sp. BR 1433]|uniref:SPRY domain-containing protein n=1 Tax=Bradyrhizobium sp. BR 1433 TaxID=3447967 RepID=UPI003EE5C73E
MNKRVDDIYAVEFTAVPYIRCSFGWTAANFDPSTAIHAVVSNHNLTVTGTAPGGGGALVFASEAKSSGKYYFEIQWVSLGGFLFGGEIGIASTSATVGDLAGPNNATMLFQGNIPQGQIWLNGAYSSFSLGLITVGDVIGIAVDIDNGKVWFKNVTDGGLWNGASAAGDPASSTNGVAIPAGSVIPAVGFGINNDIYTANFGARSFAGAVPAGFTPGWFV